MTFAYDDLADVMHISFAKPTTKCTYMDSASGAVLRIEESTGRIVGARILGFQRAIHKGSIDIPEMNDDLFIPQWLVDHRSLYSARPISSRSYGVEYFCRASPAKIKGDLIRHGC